MPRFRVSSTERDIRNVVENRKRFAVICDRVENVEPLLPNGCAHLMPTDGPYHGVKSHGWDNEHGSDTAFLNWKRERYAAWKRILASNGTLYDFASPQMGARVEVACREHFNVLGTVTWFKQAMALQKCPPKCGFDLQRNFVPFSERIVVAEQKGSDAIALGESRYGAECDRLRGFVFEPLRAYLDGERKRAGVGKDECNEACGFSRSMGGMAARHYFSQSQWCLPTREHYESMRARFNRDGGNFLARPYAELRTQYEELRRPFNVTPEDQYTDVWSYSTVPYRKDKHPCEKPEAMARDIVRISSRPNDVVLVFFSGSGIFASEALKQGRRVIAVEMDPHWAAVTEHHCIEATS